MSSFEDLEREIENVRDEFYCDSGKNRFFKKQQKFDCAKQVAATFPIEMLLNQTCWIHSTTNTVLISYPILKTYASPEIFETITDHIISMCVISKNGSQKSSSMRVLLNLEGFTFSAAERYKQLIEIYCEKCFRANFGFSNALETFVIYNAPTTIDAIRPLLAPFIMEDIKDKIKLISKKDSPLYLMSLGIGV
jgi:hypothetical protein